MGGAASVGSETAPGVDEATAAEGVSASVVTGPAAAASAGVAVSESLIASCLGSTASSVLSMPGCVFPAADGVPL